MFHHHQVKRSPDKRKGFHRWPGHPSGLLASPPSCSNPSSCPAQPQTNPESFQVLSFRCRNFAAAEISQQFRGFHELAPLWFLRQARSEGIWVKSLMELQQCVPDLKSQQRCFRLLDLFLPVLLAVGFSRQLNLFTECVCSWLASPTRWYIINQRPKFWPILEP